MFRKLFRSFFTILGGLIGFEAFELTRYLLAKAGGSAAGSGLTQSEEIWLGVFFVFIFGLIFYRVAPALTRKSRKVAAAEPVCEAAPLQIFPTAIYARLSVENSGKSEKVDVITNQIEICKSYIAGCPYLDLVDVYVDNGRTGTVFDRPEFNRLMTDIKSGRIKCLVVRDLSRFGRDYIETGTYLERIFPQIG